MRYDNQLKEEIKSKLSLVDYISKNHPEIELRKVGDKYTSKCPFHSETKASFYIYPNQTYTCFGCKIGGDIFKFLMDTKRISYPEAIQYLGEYAGIETSLLQEEREMLNKDRKKRNDLYAVMEKAAEFFHKHLLESDEGNNARKYLVERNLEMDTIKAFKLGYAPKENYSRELMDFISLGNEEILDEASLVLQNETGRRWVWFRDRIIFPFNDSFGRVLGFAGRAIDDTILPKYINSKESLIYEKNSYLYGLDKARLPIYEEKKAIIVEGYIDTLANHQYGFGNTAGLCGTSFTKNQARLIKKYTQNIILCYDNDESGVNAALKSGLELINADLETRLILLPKGDKKKIDPAEFFQSNYASEFLKLEKNALPVFEYKLETIKKKILERRFADDDSKIINEMLPFIDAAPNLLKKQIYIGKIAKEFDLEKRVIIKALNSSRFFHEKEHNHLEEELLQVMFRWPSTIDYIGSNMKENPFSTPMLNALYHYILENKNSEHMAELGVSSDHGLFHQPAHNTIIREIKRYGKKKRISINEEKISSIFGNILMKEEKTSLERIDFLIDAVRKKYSDNKVAEIQEKIKGSKNPSEVSSLLDKYIGILKNGEAQTYG
jgi:DNA primase